MDSTVLIIQPPAGTVVALVLVNEGVVFLFDIEYTDNIGIDNFINKIKREKV